TLADLLRREGALSVNATLAVLDYVCTAVGELHERGVVHRDIKPGNVLLDADGRAFITDFGLACARAAAGERALAGTPVYMAPEMFDGAISPRSDVYAIAVMAYQLLTGELPFRGEVSEISNLQRSAPLPLDPLGQRNIDAALIDVIERAAHKDPKFRYKTAQHLLRALQDVFPDPAIWAAGRHELAALVSRPQRRPAAAATISAEASSSYYDTLSTLARNKHGDAPPPKPTPPRADVVALAEPAGTVEGDLPCIQCGYNLRGLPAAARCPECGAESARSQRGDLLRFANPDWLQRVKLGTDLLFWGIIGLMAAGIVGATVGRPGPSAASAVTLLLQILVAAVVVTSLFLISAQEPRITFTEAQFSWRRLVRAAAVTSALAQVVSAVAQARHWAVLLIPAASVAAVTDPVKYFAAFAYLRSFAVRIPDQRLARSSNIVKWGLGIVRLIANVGGIAALFAMPALTAAAASATAPTTAPAAGAAAVSESMLKGGSGALLAILAAIGGCSLGLCALVLEVWAFILLWQYRSVFAATIAGREATNLGLRFIPSGNPAALWAYYLGIFALVPGIGVILGTLSLIFGLKGRAAQRRDPSVRGGAHAWVGILLGGFSVLAHLGCGILLLLAWLNP
ncbi:MAG TPA: serine/threonine-protein kinase, partial [Phycisphaerae bacterium]